VAPVKLDVLRELWKVTIEQPEPGRVVLRKTNTSGFWGKKHGIEVVVTLPRTGRAIGEVTVTGTTFGAPDRQYVKAAEEALPRFLADVRTELGNVADRRRHPRVPTALPLVVYPLHSDGRLEAPIQAQTRDVSAGGVGIETAQSFRTKYMYLAFTSVPQTKGLVILTRVMRSQGMQGDPAFLYGGQFRTDLT
jgi:hypothetical protein